MKATILTLAIAILAGCSPAPKPRQVNGDIRLEQLSAWSAETFGSEVFSNFVSAIDGETNRDTILARYAALADHHIIERLAAWETRSEIQRKLDTLARRTNRHPYTREQLEAALRLKDEKAQHKKSAEN